MIDLQLTVDLNDPTPPYEQLRRQLVGHIVTERLAVGVRLPTVRQLAIDLGLAPGTVARAYRELEEAGLITTGRAQGTHVAERRAQPSMPAEVTRSAEVLATAARAHGLGLDATIEALRAAW